MKACTACNLVKYCNRECQIAHRPLHKRACKKRAAELHDKLYSRIHLLLKIVQFVFSLRRWIQTTQLSNLVVVKSSVMVVFM